MQFFSRYPMCSSNYWPQYKFFSRSQYFYHECTDISLLKLLFHLKNLNIQLWLLLHNKISYI